MGGIVSDARWAYSLLSTTGLSFATLAVALLTHTLLWWAQLLGLLSGDYDAHAHGSIALVSAMCVTAGSGAAFVYFLHVFTRTKDSLADLARSCLRTLHLRLGAFLALAGGAVLYAMESCEQLAAHHLDGPMSAFGGTPVVGFAVLVTVALLVMGFLRAVCAWLADAHERIVRVVALFVRRGVDAQSPAFARRDLECSPTRRALLVIQTHGTRAPPLDLAF